MPSVPRLIRLLPGILAPLLACSAARAQIHDEKPLPGLEEGLLFQAAVTAGEDELSPQKLADPKTADVGAKDFAVCFWAMVHNGKLVASTLSKSSNDTGWTISTKHSVDVRLQHPSLKDGITMSAPIREEQGAGWHHVAVVIRRDPRQPLSGIWIDGVERVSIAVPPVSFSCPDSPLQIQYTHPFSRLEDLRIYNRALTRSEILELGLRSSRREGAQTSSSATPATPSTPNAQNLVPPHVGNYTPKPKHPAPPPNGPRFIPQPDETIALIGGTEAVALAESGELEALLLMAFPQTRFHFRSLAWEGDTVFKQDRPMNFGSLEQQLRRVNAGAVFVMFGRQECLDEGVRDKGKGIREEAGSAGNLPGFKIAFEKLLDTVAKVTPNIVVIGPVPFEKKKPPLTDLSGQNKDLALYSRAMADSATSLQAPFCNLLSPDDTTVSDGLTSDGVTLTTRGCVGATVGMTRQLALPAGSLFSGASVAVAQPGGLLQTTEALRKPIQSKNRLWHDYWRPSNWAFLHGDRTNQPSSRDPVNPQIRFFPAEQEKYFPLIKEAEDKVFQLVQEGQKKLP